MNNSTTNNSIVFDIKGLAEYLGVSTQLIRKYVKEKNIPHFKMGKKYLFRQSVIEEYLASQEKKQMCLERQLDMQKTIKRINQI